MKVPNPFAPWMDKATARRAVGAPWPATLDRSKVFILPSAFGLLAGMAVFVMLLVALNYQNSAVFLLAFFLGALLVVAMVSCHQQLHGLVIVHAHSTPVFAGEPIRLKIGVVNRGRRSRDGLSCCSDQGQGQTNGPSIRVPTEGEARLELVLAPRTRGRHTLRRLHLDCREPFGAFRAWSRLATMECIVYPRPAVDAAPPPGNVGLMTRGKASHQPEDFLGLARYRPGDRPSQIEWRHYARGGALERKHFGGAGGGTAWLDLDDAPGTDVEGRLSVLCAWVLAAEREGAQWGLRLPGYRLTPGRGARHLEGGLTALALYPGPYS